MTTLHHAIDLNPAAIAHADAADKADRTLQPREVLVPLLVDGVVQLYRCQVLCSDTYHDPVPVSSSGGNDHSWKFTPTTPTGATGGTLLAGLVWIGGVPKTVTGLPGTLTGVTTSTIYWIAIDFSAATATWGSGATLPDNTDTVEYWRVLVLTCDGGVITNVFQPWPADIHALLNP